MNKKMRVLIATVLGFIILAGLALLLGSKQVTEFFKNLFAKGSTK